MPSGGEPPALAPVHRIFGLAHDVRSDLTVTLTARALPGRAATVTVCRGVCPVEGRSPPLLSPLSADPGRCGRRHWLVTLMIL